MSSPSRKKILIAGLGRFITADPNATAKFGPASDNKQRLADNLKAATDAGFDCSSIDINPNDPEGSLAELKATLEDLQYDGFIIGYGLRGNKDFTELFEKIVNLAVEVTEGRIRFGFSPAPDGVFETIRRTFAEQ